MSNRLIGPSLNLIGSQIPAGAISKLGLDPLISGLSNIGTKVSGGISSLGTKLGLVSPAAPAGALLAIGAASSGSMPNALFCRGFVWTSRSAMLANCCPWAIYWFIGSFAWVGGWHVGSSSSHGS